MSTDQALKFVIVELVLVETVLVGDPLYMKVSDFDTSERFFVNSLNLSMNLNCFLVNHNLLLNQRRTPQKWLNENF